MKELFSDSNKVSMGRLLSFSATFWGLIMLSVMSVMALSKSDDIDIGMNVAIAWVTVIGLGFGAKVSGKFAEKKK